MISARIASARDMGQIAILMDNETVKHLWALRKVNDALIEGLKTAIFVLEKEDDL